MLAKKEHVKTVGTGKHHWISLIDLFFLDKGNKLVLVLLTVEALEYFTR
jgi:hypothetical protein